MININPSAEQAYRPMMCGSGMIMSEQIRTGKLSAAVSEYVVVCAVVFVCEDIGFAEQYKKLKLARSFPSCAASERRSKFFGESVVSKVK